MKIRHTVPRRHMGGARRLMQAARPCLSSAELNGLAALVDNLDLATELYQRTREPAENPE